MVVLVCVYFIHIIFFVCSTAPQLYITPSDYIVDGTKANIDLSKSVGCAARSNYSGFLEMNVVWYRNDGGHWNRVNSTFSLFTAADNGQYMCQVRSYFGSVNSTSVQVEVYGKKLCC